MKGKKNRAQILGENLKRIRTEKGISRKDLAAAIGVSVAAIGQYESGINTPVLEKIFEIANFLQVSVASLTGENDFADNAPDINTVEKIFFEFRLQRAIEILKSADCEVDKIGKKNFIVSFKLNFMHSERGKLLAIQEVPIALKLLSDELIEIVEKAEKISVSKDSSYRLRDLLYSAYKGENEEELKSHVLAKIDADLT